MTNKHIVHAIAPSEKALCGFSNNRRRYFWRKRNYWVAHFRGADASRVTCTQCAAALKRQAK